AEGPGSRAPRALRDSRHVSVRHDVGKRAPAQWTISPRDATARRAGHLVPGCSCSDNLGGRGHGGRAGSVTGVRGPNPDGLAATGARVELYAGFTFSARGPLGPWPTVNVTLSPSRMESKGVLVHAEL